MNRNAAVSTWREVCGSDTVMAIGVATGSMLEQFARRIESAERERWREHLKTVLAGIDAEELDSPQGWWETSAAAARGAEILRRALEGPAP